MITNEITQYLGLEGEWTAVLSFGPRSVDGPVSITVSPTDPERPPHGGLSSVALREIDIRAAIKAREPRTSGSAAGRWRMEQNGIREARQLFESEGVTDHYLTALSQLYLSAVERGEHRPLRWLADRTGRTYSTVKSHLWQATRRGILERSSGRAGGALTEKGKALSARNARPGGGQDDEE
ncbi:hypothetical protein [Saccharomonospora halophila]|uniref:hypothetical protein n=1 Tax=Saccharomonospora halophila TaxID=129922 RepID=UPI000362F331|nr:hypothetical protein [Saccharomonospora halophila]